MTTTGRSRPTLEQLAALTQGTVVIADFRDSLGHEQTKVRPAVVVSASFLNARSLTVVVVPISTMRRSVPRLTETVLAAGVCGLTAASVAQAQQLRAVDRARILDICGELPAGEIRSILETIQIVLGAGSPPSR